MAKPEPYNFSAHLKAIVMPVLKQQGFTLKGTKFVRAQGPHQEEIYFQRSSWNLPVDVNGPSEFYLNVTLGGSSPTPSGRLDKPSALPEPAHRSLQMKLPREERSAFHDSLNESQRAETRKYLDSRRWLYESEGELAMLLREALSVLDSHLNTKEQ